MVDLKLWYQDFFSKTPAQWQNVDQSYLFWALRFLIKDYQLETIRLKYGFNCEPIYKNSRLAEVLGKRLGTIRKHCNDAIDTILESENGLEAIQILFTTKAEAREKLQFSRERANKAQAELLRKLEHAATHFSNMRRPTEQLITTKSHLELESWHIEQKLLRLADEYAERNRCEPQRLVSTYIITYMEIVDCMDAIENFYSMITKRIRDERKNKAGLYSYGQSSKLSSKARRPDTRLGDNNH